MDYVKIVRTWWIKMITLLSMIDIKDIILDCLLDSLKVLGIAFILYFIISFVEDKISKVLGKKNHFSPLIGASLGLIPQCGISVIGANLYLAHHITMGTLVALFISCSDEAIPILLTSTDSTQLLSILLIIGIKFVLGFVVGFITDFYLYKRKKEVEDHVHEECDHDFDEVEGCCHHKIGSGNKESFWRKHLVHPLLHSIKIFLYCLLINLIFGFLIYIIGEDNIREFLTHFRYFSPVIASLVGMIPNCASSVLIAESYISGAIGIGAVVGGLSINAGLGLVFIFRKKESMKDSLTILGILMFTSIVSGYILALLFGF